MALALCDHDTPLWLDPPLAASEAVRTWLAFHCGAPLTEAPAEALFALAAEPARLPELALFGQGTQDYPDRSTTLILAVATLEDGPALRLEGPRHRTPGTARRRASAAALFRRVGGQWRALPARRRSRPGGAGRRRLPAAHRAHRRRRGLSMYVAVKGGEAAIAHAHRLLADRRRGSREVPALRLDQIVGQLALAVDRAMAEGSLYDPELAALALVQARGDLIEAIFLVRAYRTTLPRFGYTRPVDTAEMAVERRVSATYKDLPGGQLLGPTFDYTHRLLDPDVVGASPEEPARRAPPGEAMPRVTALLAAESLIEDDGALPEGRETADITREPLDFPLERDGRLQALARGDEGFLLALAYSTQRGYGRSHPFVGEIRIGMVELELDVPELPFPVSLGSVRLTECQMVNQFKGSAKAPPQFTRGYGLVFGQSERKAMAVALCDRALRAGELGEERVAPAQDEEFVLSHADNVQATGFVEHLKLPHYVDFQAELDLVRRMRAEFEAGKGLGDDAAREAAE